MINFKKMIPLFSANDQKLQCFLLVLLSMFTIKIGVIPAWNSVNSDFPNYYISARLLTIASPSPVPLPGSLVVKKGSNTWVSTSVGMPVPVSLTWMQA